MLAVNAFYNIDYRGFKCVNGALLTLIPKISDAQEAKDFRPISLIHSFPKILAKLLANRLSTKINDLVLCNQSAFIRGRYILDNFKYVQRSATLIKKKKIPKLLLKLDISKAFDTVSWQFLLEVCWRSVSTHFIPCLSLTVAVSNAVSSASIVNLFKMVYLQDFQ